MDYPLPSNAASIWLAGDTIWMAFPPLAGHTHGHSVHFPATSEGLRIALNILRERSRARDFRIGTAAAPVQYDPEEISRKLAQKRDEAEDLLAELGL